MGSLTFCLYSDIVCEKDREKMVFLYPLPWQLALTFWKFSYSEQNMLSWVLPLLISHLCHVRSDFIVMSNRVENRGKPTHLSIPYNATSFYWWLHIMFSDWFHKICCRLQFSVITWISIPCHFHIKLHVGITYYVLQRSSRRTHQPKPSNQ